MNLNRKFLVLSLVLALVVTTTIPILSAEKHAPGRSIILSAFTYQLDNGTWKGESGPFLNQLEDPVAITERVPTCELVVEGDLYDQPVTVVTMGGTKISAATCMLDLLDYYGGSKGLQEVIWSGISGFTPMVGGLVDREGNRRDAAPTAIGDVCVNYFAVDWDLQHSSIGEKDKWWRLSFPSENHLAVGDKELAQELWQASQQVTWPEVPEGPKENIAKYHGEDAIRKAKAWDWNQCAEATGDNFWHSVAEDRRARELIANAMEEVTGKETQTSEIIAVTAMEQTAWMNAIEEWEDNYDQEITFAYTRSSSNYDHPWLNERGKPAVSGKESIAAGMEEGGGTPYGCKTAALPVLKLFELRASN